MYLSVEIWQKIIALVGKKSLFRQLYGSYIPLSCYQIIRNQKIKQILHGREIIPCCDIFDNNVLDIDFCAQLFRECFYRREWKILLKLTISLCVFSKFEVKIFVKKILHELETLRVYVHNELVCYFLESQYYNFTLEFENINEFIKFYVFIELYTNIDISLDQNFYNRMIISSYYDFYDFLIGRDILEKVRYRSICLYRKQPYLSTLMENFQFNEKCRFCNSFDEKWYQFRNCYSAYTRKIINYNYNEYLLDKIHAYYFIEFSLDREEEEFYE